jgi:arylsulfatase
MEADRGENTDLAARYPEVVEQLKEKYKKWAAANDVVDYSRLKTQQQPQQQQGRGNAAAAGRRL